jgi:hypothetical protein
MINIHDHGDGDGDEDEDDENKQELLLLPYETRLVYASFQSKHHHFKPRSLANAITYKTKRKTN